MEEVALSAPQLCYPRRSWDHQAKLKIETCEAEVNSCNSFELQAKLFHSENCSISSNILNLESEGKSVVK